MTPVERLSSRPMNRSPRFRESPPASRAARSGQPIECLSTTRRPLAPPSELVSSCNTINTIMWAPAEVATFGCTRFTHRTETMDYALQLSGELDCELDGGEVVHLTPGDVIVQRGTIHTW